ETSPTHVREVAQGPVILRRVQAAVVLDEETPVEARTADFVPQRIAWDQLDGARCIGLEQLGPSLQTGIVAGGPGEDETAAAHIVYIERMPLDQLLDVIERGLRILENALLPGRDMGSERARHNDLLPPRDHSTAARAGANAELARIKHHDTASRSRQLDGRRQAAVPAADDGNVHPFWKRRLGRGRRRGRLPPIGGLLHSFGMAGAIATAPRSPPRQARAHERSCALDRPWARV